MSAKQSSCDQCPVRSKSKNETERHEISLNVCRSFWSRAALTSLKGAVHRTRQGAKLCGYCGFSFLPYDSDQTLIEHLISCHKFGDCDGLEEFRANHVDKHSEHGHGNSSLSDMTNLEEIFESIVHLDDTRSSSKEPDGPIGAGRIAQSPPSSVNRKRSLSGSSEERNQGVSLLSMPTASVPPAMMSLSINDPSSSSAISRETSINKSCDTCRHGGIKCHVLEHDRPHKRSRVESGLCVYDNAFHSGDESNSHSVLDPSRSEDLIPQAVAIQSLSETGLSTPSTPPPLTVSVVEADQSQFHFVCSTCQRSFTRRAILEKHQRTHTGEKPFSCRIPGCNLTFAQQSDKTRHEQAQHSKKSFRCGGSHGGSSSWGCGKTFRKKDGLLEHHRKTAKGQECLAQRDKIIELQRTDVGSSFTL